MLIQKKTCIANNTIITNIKRFYKYYLEVYVYIFHKPYVFYLL